MLRQGLYPWTRAFAGAGLFAGPTRVAAVAIVLLAAACGGDSRTVLTVYSPHGKDLLTAYEQGFERAHPDVDVQWVDMGSQEVLERLRAEAANPQADVWFGAPAEAFERAAGEHLLDTYTPTWAAAVPADARDSAGYWFGTYLTPEVIAYNTEAVTAAAAPKDWEDVLDPKWKGKVLIRDPVASGTMRAIFGAIIGQAMTRTGKPDDGYAWLERLDASTKEYVLNPTILYQKLARQEGLITLWDMPDIALLQERDSMPIGYVVPASGTPMLVDAIAIVHGTHHEAVARQFYEFVTTPEALLTAAKQFQRIPVRTDIPSDSMPGWIRDAREHITPMPVDRALTAAHLDEWMTYWDSNIRNSSKRK